MLGEGQAQLPAGKAAFLMRKMSSLDLGIRKAWRRVRLPADLRQSSPTHSRGTILREIVRHGESRQFADGFFFRDRPQLELIRRLVERDAVGTSSKRTMAGRDPGPICITGLQDIVVASNFRHLTPGEAETCLRNLAAW